MGIMGKKMEAIIMGISWTEKRLSCGAWRIKAFCMSCHSRQSGWQSRSEGPSTQIIGLQGPNIIIFIVFGP